MAAFEECNGRAATLLETEGSLFHEGCIDEYRRGMIGFMAMETIPQKWNQGQSIGKKGNSFCWSFQVL